jgi:hypothetical protein
VHLISSFANPHGSLAFGFVFQSQTSNLLINKHLLASFRNFTLFAPTALLGTLAASRGSLPHGSISSGERKPQIDDLHNSKYMPPSEFFHFMRFSGMFVRPYMFFLLFVTVSARFKEHPEGSFYGPVTLGECPLGSACSRAFDGVQFPKTL